MGLPADNLINKRFYEVCFLIYVLTVCSVNTQRTPAAVGVHFPPVDYPAIKFMMLFSIILIDKMVVLTCNHQRFNQKFALQTILKTIRL